MKDRLLTIAEVFDAWRVFPRLVVLVWLYLIVRLVFWFMALPDISIAQGGFLGSVAGLGTGGIFGFYVKTGRSWPTRTVSNAEP